MEQMQITPKTSISDLLSNWPQAVQVFLERKMSCPGCSMSAFETLEEASHIYQVDLHSLMDDLNQFILEHQPYEENHPEHTNSHTNQTANNKESGMNTPYTYFPALSQTVEGIPMDSIISRTIYRDDHLKAILFAFAPGQELSEHTASVPAIIQILEGECELTLGSDHFDAQAGAWARMPANLPHSIIAKTPVKMLLIMLP